MAEVHSVTLEKLREQKQKHFSPDGEYQYLILAPGLDRGTVDFFASWCFEEDARVDVSGAHSPLTEGRVVVPTQDGNIVFAMPPPNTFTWFKTEAIYSLALVGDKLYFLSVSQNELEGLLRGEITPEVG